MKKLDLVVKGYICRCKSSLFIKLIMSKIFENIKQIVAEAEADVTKFYGGNNAAGGRVRKAMQDLKTLATELRKDVLETKNARKPSK